MRLIRLLLEHPVTAVLLTGDTSPQRIAKLRNSGTSSLHKPIAAETLREMVEHLLQAEPSKAQATG